MYKNDSDIIELIDKILDENSSLTDEEILDKIINPVPKYKAVLNDTIIEKIDTKINLCFPRIGVNGYYFLSIKNTPVENKLFSTIYTSYNDKFTSQSFYTKEESSILTRYKLDRTNVDKQTRYNTLKKSMEMRAKIKLDYKRECEVEGQHYDMTMNYLLLLINEWAKRGYAYKVTSKTGYVKTSDSKTHADINKGYSKNIFEYIKAIYEKTKKLDIFLYLYNSAYNGVTHIHIFINKPLDMVKLHDICILYKYLGQHYRNNLSNETEIPGLEKLVYNSQYMHAISLSLNYNINTILDYCEEFLVFCNKRPNIDVVKAKFKSIGNAPGIINTTDLGPDKKRAILGNLNLGIPFSKYNIEIANIVALPLGRYINSAGRELYSNNWDSINLEFRV